MARGGINKTLVQKARDALVARGANPSINAVRGELGNTGSMTTISRYLREIEEESGSRLNSQELLSDTLTELVGRLAAQMRDEAKSLVEAAEERYKEGQKVLRHQNAELQKALDMAKTQASSLVKQLESKGAALLTAEESLQSSRANEQCLEQQVSDLENLQKEKSSHILSLEQKHQHNREALEHYRKSVKDQRDQDLQRHEQQVQQLQAEQRHLNQTISLKQSEITQITKDNARLATELAQTQKQLRNAEGYLSKAKDQVRGLDKRVEALKLETTNVNKQLSLQSQSIHDTNSQLQQALEDCQRYEHEITALKSEIRVKDSLLGRQIPNQ